MPHLTLEYTDNIDFDVQPLLARLHNELVATGAINLKGLKSRVIRHSEYRIADGNPEYAYVHINLLIREGRPSEVQQELAQRIAERPLSDEDMRSFRRRVFSGAADLTPDRQGRILLPQYLRDFAEIDGEVVIAGMFDYLEIWSVEAWQSVRQSIESTSDADRWEDLGI